MPSSRSEIRFIKPCRPEGLGFLELTAEYCSAALNLGKVVQINLDNCSLQRMEELTDEATLDDVEKVGLLPLVKILNTGVLVTMTAIGINEMPDKWVGRARAAYESFCRKFWPGHKDDVEATERSYDRSSTAKKLIFHNLPNNQRVTYGCAYVPLLQIQNIGASFPSLSPELQFEAHLHSIAQFLDIVSEFELEIAKYAYWKIDHKEAATLPDRVAQRRRDIKENFTKQQNSLAKCQEYALNGAMDLHWLSGSKLAEDIGVYLNVGGKKYLVDNWVGTNDHKLYRISQDIYSVFYNNSTQTQLSISRENAMTKYDYWRKVDDASTQFRQYRQTQRLKQVTDLLERIDAAVQYIEESLARVFFGKRSVTGD